MFYSFFQRVPARLVAQLPRRYWARNHTLSEPWCKIMGPKNWATLSEETLHKGIAAWRWLQSYCSERMVDQNIALSHGQLSKLAVEQQFMQRVDADGNQQYLGYCLGHATWAAIFWPALLFMDEVTGFGGFFLDPDAAAQWIFITNPQEWKVVPTKAQAFGCQIFMVPDLDRTEPLLKYYLRDVALHKHLLVADMQFLLTFLKVPFEKKTQN